MDFDAEKGFPFDSTWTIYTTSITLPSSILASKDYLKVPRDELALKIGCAAWPTEFFDSGLLQIGQAN